MPRFMSHNSDKSEMELPLEVTRRIDALCDEFESAIKLGAPSSLEGYANRIEPRWRSRLLGELVGLALERMQESGILDAEPQLLAANPSIRDELARLLADASATVTADYQHSSSGKSSGLPIRCPHCHSMIELIVDESLVEITCRNCDGTFSLVNDAVDTRSATTVSRVAHFELIERLGMGQFGTVWKAREYAAQAKCGAEDSAAGAIGAIVD